MVLTEIDPLGQKTRPDFEVTARRLGIAIVDIRSLEPAGNRLYYRNGVGQRVPMQRIYNRATMRSSAMYPTASGYHSANFRAVVGGRNLA